MRHPINLDANATYGVLAEVREGLDEALGALNPSSIHSGGQQARAAIELARDRLGSLLGLQGRERIIFTSGATEANTQAVWAPFWSLLSRAERPNVGWLTGASEHHSILEPCARLGQLGIGGRVLETPDGALSGEQVGAAITPETRLVCAMYANNETGHLTPLSEIASAVRRAAQPIHLHVDAVQMLGKIPAALFELDIDSASVSAHKIGGLPGVGALVLRAGLEVEPLLVGGAQETRRRAGTENVAGIVAFGLAAAAIERTVAVRAAKMLADRQFLEGELEKAIPGARFNHPRGAGLPNTISLTIPGVRADDVVVALDLYGVLASSGAACASGKPDPSHVLAALGLSESEARATLRLSLRADHSREELQRAAGAIAAAAGRGRAA